MNSMVVGMGSNAATEAFSRQSAVFDAIDAANPLISWVRDRVRKQALDVMKAGDTVLELNAGTGIDSVHFAKLGMKVLATDAAPGMVRQLEAKKQALSTLPLEVRAYSFLELDRIRDRRFQHVFSNFGGLNCTDRLDVVLRGIDRVLLPHGTCTLVIMPRFSPWEAMAALKGNFALARRRWNKDGTRAHLEGVEFRCHYYSPDYVRHHLGPGYDTIAQRGLSLLVPPPHHAGFDSRWPRLFRMLSDMEDAISHLPYLRNLGDHFVITLRKRG
ncbi:MAG: methyltransferase domain-containing protein [Flavobacteriales bacterium]|nr:methyltransferase domain-containing protein [Flavobacteriales bacterium]